MNLFSQLKKILNRFILKTSGLIFVFIVAGNLIAIQSGITNQVSKIFYWEERGTVAGKYTVKMALDNLDERGLIAMPRESGKIYLGWRFLADDSSTFGFNIYRGATAGGPYNLVNPVPISASTNYLDETTVVGSTYYYIVKPVNGGVEGASSNEIFVTAQSTARDYFSFATSGYNKAGVGDLNGDGWFDFVILEPRIMKADESAIINNKKLPASQEYKLAAYTHNGTLLWRFNTHLGQNEKDYEWAHSANFTVYDLNNDGQAEVVAIIKDGADYKLAKLDGESGAVLVKSASFPNAWTNEVVNGATEYFRIYVAVAYLDGTHPNVVMQAGRGREACNDSMDAHVIAFDNNNLNVLWDTNGSILGDCQAGHGMEIVDADGNGDDEILMGDNLIDGNLTSGSARWSRNIGHTDVMVSGDIDPGNPGLEILFGWEAPWRANGAKLELVRASDGQALWTKDNKDEIHHGGIGNFTDDDGLESFAYDTRGYHAGESEVLYLVAADGTELPDAKKWGLERFPVRWSGNGYSQLLDPYDENPVRVKNYDKSTIRTFDQIVTQKWQEVAAADLMGDWRDEIIGEAPDGTLYIFTNTNVIDNRAVTPLQDRLYRVNMTRFNQGYYRHLNTSGQRFVAYNAPNCSAQICQPGQSCSGSWVEAGNTNYCCQGTCGTAPSCTPGSSCTTAQSCPGTYDSGCVCVDVAGDNCPTGGSAGAKIKIADNARDPAIAIDKTGAAHIVYGTNCYLKNGRPLSCDMMYVKYICQNQQGIIDESSRKKIGTGANARVAPDANNNIHIAWDHPGISGREGIKYNKIENGNPVWTEGRLLFANPPGVEKARIAVDNNEVYISFQNMPHVSFVHFDAAAFSPSTPAFPALFTTAQNIDENPDSDPKGVRQGGIAVDTQNGVHFSWSHYPKGGYYRKYGNGTFYAVQWVTQGLGEEATSDFTSLSVNKNNNEIVYVAQPGNVDNPSNPFYGHLWYQNLGTDVNNEKLSAYNFGTEVGLIDDGDNLNVEVAVDTRNISYVTFAGSNLKQPIEESVDANGNPLPHTCGDNICQWAFESFEQNVPGMEYCPNDCGHYAYYFTVDQSGAYSGEAAFRLTPSSINNNQGGKKTNPVPAPARNQGVYVVFEDNAENINYNAYLISLDGADVCGQSQSLSLKADFNCDGKVDVQDFGILLSHWEKTEPPAILEHYANAGCVNTNTTEKNLDLNCGKKIINNQEVRDIHIDGDDFGPLLGCWGTPDPNVSAVCYGVSQCQ